MRVIDNVTDITVPVRLTKSTLPYGSDLFTFAKETITGLTSQSRTVLVIYPGVSSSNEPGLWTWNGGSYDTGGRPVLMKPFGNGVDADLRFTQHFRDSDGASVMRVYCDGTQMAEHVDTTPDQNAPRIWLYFDHNVYSWLGGEQHWESAASARIGKITCRGAKRDWLKFEAWVNATGYGPAAYPEYQRPGDVVTDVFGLIGTRWDNGLRLDGLVDIDSDGYIYVQEYDGLNPLYMEGAVVDGYQIRQLTGYLGLRMRGTTASGRNQHATTDATGRTKYVYIGDAGRTVYYQGIERIDVQGTYSAPAAVYTGTACTCPCIVAHDTGRLCCWYMDGTQKASYSDDDGRTWQPME